MGTLSEPPAAPPWVTGDENTDCETVLHRCDGPSYAGDVYAVSR